MISFSKILLILSCPLLALAGRAVTIHFNSSSQVGVRKRLALFDCRSFKYDVILFVGLGIFSAKHLPTPAKYLANLLLIFLAPYSLILSILRYSIRLLLLECLPAVSLIIFQFLCLGLVFIAHVQIKLNFCVPDCLTQYFIVVFVLVFGTFTF